MDFERRQDEPIIPDPDDLAEQLAPVFDLPPPSPAFCAILAAQLDREYQKVIHDSSPHAIDEGTNPAPNVLKLATIESTEASPAEQVNLKAALPISGRLPRLQRWLKWGVAAACLIGAFTWWNSRSHYSWASMIAALEEARWVQLLVELQPGESAEGWFSGEQRVVALKGQGQVRLDDYAQGERLLFVQGNKAVGRSEIEKRASPSTERHLLSLLFSALGDTNINDRVEAGTLKVLDESWRRSDDGMVELTVRLTIGDSRQPLTLRFSLDPRTRLPQRAQVVSADRNHVPSAEDVKFSYPQDGPRDIYSLGTSRDLPIVASSDVAKMAQEIVKNLREEGAITADKRPAADSTNADTANRIAIRPQRSPASPPKKELSPPRSISEMAERVDALLQQHWTRMKLMSADAATDAQFVRRVYLDFTGRIPTVSEVRAFISDDRPDRREKLIDQLLQRYDHASHLAAVWRTFLIPETADLTALGGVQEFEAWLTDRFRNNQSYDQLVTDLLTAEGRAQASGPLLFYAALKLRPEEIARQTSRAFLGLQMDCAQCHDHFFDDRIKQSDFWGYAAFFARISQPEGKLDRVSPVMRVRDSMHGEVVLPGTDEVVLPRFPFDAQSLSDLGEASRRRVLAAWLTSPDNPHFARATVNRVWSQLFGRGIVNPVDDMREANAPICPELLTELSDYFVSSGYDLRRLYATLARTRAYQLSSASAASDPARVENFAQMNLKCLSAEQLYDCISVATRIDAVTESATLNRLDNYNRQTFIEQFRAPPGNTTEYQAGIAQALTLINGSLSHSATQLQTSGLLRSLQAPFFTDEQRVETLFLATVSRLPNEREKTTMLAELQAARTGEERSAVLGDVLWALLNSAEFTLNH